MVVEPLAAEDFVHLPEMNHALSVVTNTELRSERVFCSLGILLEVAISEHVPRAILLIHGGRLALAVLPL